MRVEELIELNNCDVDLHSCLVRHDLRDSSGNLIACGLLKPLYEVIILFDPELSKKRKVLALNELIQVGLIESKQSGIKQWHAFCKDEFIPILTKDYGFVECKDRAVFLRL